MTAQTAIAKRESLAVQTARELGITNARLQLVKDTFAKGATDDELSLFLLTAHRTGLDPAARQIFAIKRWDSSLKRETMSVQVSIDGFRLIADRTGRYVPGRETTFTYDAKGDLESATAYIKKYVGGIWHEISATAFYSEYAQTTKDGQPNRMWSKMPRLMLGKCAESLALRKAFPAELSGLYTPDEMNTDPSELNQNQPMPHSSVKSQHAEDARNKIAVLIQNDADRAAFEIYHEERTGHLPVKNEPPPNPLNEQLGKLCTALNEAKDSISWTAKKLTDYANELLDSEVESYLRLDDEKKEVLIGDLQGRLDEAKERAAIESEAIDAEVITETEKFQEEVF